MIDTAGIVRRDNHPDQILQTPWVIGDLLGRIDSEHAKSPSSRAQGSGEAEGRIVVVLVPTAQQGGVASVRFAAC